MENKQTGKTVVILYFKDNNLKKNKIRDKRFSSKLSFLPPKFRIVDLVFKVRLECLTPFSAFMDSKSTFYIILELSLWLKGLVSVFIQFLKFMMRFSAQKTYSETIFVPQMILFWHRDFSSSK